MKTKRLEFLEEMVAHYSENPKERRCISIDGKCVYDPKTINHPTSEGCAIGRRCDEATKEILSDGCGVNSDWIFKKLPEWMQDLGIGFLYDVQILHDSDNYWTETGLSESGKEKVEKIKNDHCL